MVKRSITTRLKKALQGLIIPLTTLLYCNSGLSQNKLLAEHKLSTSDNTNDITWIESHRNIELRKNKEIPFFYPYDFPDAKRNAWALFRTYRTPLNNGFAIIEVANKSGNLKTLKGRAKFSGSDIDRTKDTLIIAAYYSKIDSLSIANLNKGLIPDKADVIKLSEPLAQFEPFYIPLSEPIKAVEKKYLIIQLIIKSGSDDNYYYGTSNAVVDNIHFNEENTK